MKNTIKLATLTLAATTMLSAASYANDQAHNQSMKNTPSYTAEEAKEMAKETWEETKDTTEDMLDKTEDTAEEAWETTKEKTEAAWQKTKKMSKQAWSKTQAGTKDMYQEVVHMVKSEEDIVENVPYSLVHESHTANYILDKDVYDNQGVKFAKVSDIIITQDGNIKAYVLEKSKMFGLNKQFAYVAPNQLMITDKKANVLMSAEHMENNAFATYKKALQPGLISLSSIQGTKLLNSDNQKVAKVDDFVITDGEVEKVVASFNTTFGMGGEKALVSIADNQMSKVAKGHESLVLSPEQSKKLMKIKNQLDS